VPTCLMSLPARRRWLYAQKVGRVIAMLLPGR
jgi:hypothetical protein